MKKKEVHSVYKTINTACTERLGDFATYEEACRFAHKMYRQGVSPIEMYGPGYHSHYSPWYTPHGD